MCVRLYDFQSRGVDKTKQLVFSHSREANKLIGELDHSQERDALMVLTEQVRNRNK